MASITTWTRLEPRSRGGDLRSGLEARVEDPLWLLARQWQVGEFKGEDAGSPVVARLSAEVAHLTSYRPGNARMAVATCAVGEELHTVGTSTSGRLWHTARDGDGAWTPVEHVQLPSAEQAKFTHVAATGLGPDLHVFATASDRHLWYAARAAGGIWTLLEHLQLPSEQASLTRVAATALGTELHVFATTSDGGLWHTARGVTSQQLQLPSREERFTGLAATALGTELQVFASTSEGRLWHAARRGDGTWTPIAPLSPETADGGTFVAVAATGLGPDLHVFATTGDGRLRHIARRGDGSWAPSGELAPGGGESGSFIDVAVTVSGNGLHVWATSSDGSLVFTEGHPGSWLPFERLEGAEEGLPYESSALPLETMVEREVPSAGELRFAVDAGLHFLRMLEQQHLGSYKSAFIAAYPLEPPTQTAGETPDGETARFLRIVSGRAPDGRALASSLRAALEPGSAASLPASPAVFDQDKPTLHAVAGQWLEWYDSFMHAPGEQGSAWLPERMEYRFSVSAKSTGSDLVLTAPEYSEGHLDWHSFVVDQSASLPASSIVKPIDQTTYPARVSYPGMPAARWWEFEDAAVNFGAVETAPHDLARLLLVEFACIYSNDWYVIPVDLDIGSVCHPTSLVVENTFNEAFPVPPAVVVDGVDSGWRMFQLSGSTSPIFFLPPTLVGSLEGRPTEDIRFLRDEMANMAWAIERTVESPLGRPIDRFEQFQAQRQRAAAAGTGSTGTTTSNGPTMLRYRLQTRVPDYWFPLVPVAEAVGSIRLRRLSSATTEGTSQAAGPRGRVLEPGTDLRLFEEEVPRSGARVTRAYEYARWTDGSTHLWIGRRKRQGRGEGSSGLRFDIVEPMTP